MRILVVEDEASNLHILALGLRHKGHEVLEALDPMTGLERALADQPELILLDLHFKGAPIDGLEAIRRLKAHPSTADIPIVVQTAAVLGNEEARAFEAGAAAFLRKPFRRQDLLAVLETVRSARGAAPAPAPPLPPLPPPRGPEPLAPRDA